MRFHWEGLYSAADIYEIMMRKHNAPLAPRSIGGVMEFVKSQVRKNPQGGYDGFNRIIKFVKP